MEAVVKNAADPKQVKNSKKMQKHLRNKELDDLRFLLSTPQGRRYLWRHLDWCGLYRSPEDSRGDVTQRNIGAQNVARKVLAEIVEADPRSWLLMQQENYEQGEN